MTGKTLTQLEDSSGDTGPIRFFPDGKRVVGAIGPHILVWDAQSRAQDPPDVSRVPVKRAMQSARSRQVADPAAHEAPKLRRKLSFRAS